ncbi:hypothetical protein ACJJTC_011359 [Scirpophaga incertulas]
MYPAIKRFKHGNDGVCDSSHHGNQGEDRDEAVLPEDPIESTHVLPPAPDCLHYGGEEEPHDGKAYSSHQFHEEFQPWDSCCDSDCGQWRILLETSRGSKLSLPLLAKKAS